MKTTYLLCYCGAGGGLTLHSIITAKSMGEAMSIASNHKERFNTSIDRWFVFHGYEIDKVEDRLSCY